MIRWPYESSKPVVSSGVERLGSYSIAYVSIDHYDPPPGSKGYYLSWDSPYFNSGRSQNRSETKLWRESVAKDIRKLAKRLKAVPGTDFHQLIRLSQGLAVSYPPYEPRSPELEDRRLVAEFEWELRQSHLYYPSTVADLLANHHHNRNEIAALSAEG